eukprot:1939855-Rhodomonas_salina.1
MHAISRRKPCFGAVATARGRPRQGNRSKRGSARILIQGTMFLLCLSQECATWQVWDLGTAAPFKLLLSQHIRNEGESLSLEEQELFGGIMYLRGGRGDIGGEWTSAGDRRERRGPGGSPRDTHEPRRFGEGRHEEGGERTRHEAARARARQEEATERSGVYTRGARVRYADRWLDKEEREIYCVERVERHAEDMRRKGGSEGGMGGEGDAKSESVRYDDRRRKDWARESSTGMRGKEPRLGGSLEEEERQRRWRREEESDGRRDLEWEKGRKKQRKFGPELGHGERGERREESAEGSRRSGPVVREGREGEREGEREGGREVASERASEGGKERQRVRVQAFGSDSVSLATSLPSCDARY